MLDGALSVTDSYGAEVERVPKMEELNASVAGTEAFAEHTGVVSKHVVMEVVDTAVT